MTDPFFSGMFDKNSGAAPNVTDTQTQEMAPSLLFGVNDKRLPDIFGDSYLQKQLTADPFAVMGTPSNEYNPYETDFARFKNDYNYPTLGYIQDAPNNAAYYMTQTSWQGAKKAGKHFANLTWDTFLNNFAQYGRDFDALTSSKADSLWDSDYNKEIYEMTKDYHDKYYIFAPDGNEESLKKWVPFTKGSLQAYGELFSQLGFTAGTLGAAAVENLVIGLLTGGSGSLPTAAKTSAKAYSTIYDLVKFLRNEDTLMNSIRKAGKVALSPSFYGNSAKKAVNMYQMYHASAAEAAFEAAAGYAEHKEALVNDFIDTYGYGPDEDTLKEFEKQAREVGTARFGLNTAILMASNSMQWGNYLRPFKASKNVTDEVADSLYYQTGKGLGQGVVKTTYDYKLFSKGWFGNTLTKGAIGLKGAVPEGFEESLQNVIDIGTKEYITQKYGNNGDRSSVLGAAAKGFSETFGTTAGWNNFIAGALTGTISGGIRSIGESIKDKGKTKAAARSTASRMNSINLKDLLSQDKANLNVQTDAKTALMEAALADDKYGHINVKNAAFREFVFTGIRSGKFDIRLRQLEEFRNSTAKDFADFFGLDEAEVAAEGVNNIVDKLVSKAKGIEENYNFVSKKFKNPYSPNRYKSTDPKFNEEIVSYQAFEEAKTIMATLLDKTKDSAERAAELLRLEIDDPFILFKDASYPEVFDYNERAAKIKELKEVLKGTASRGPSILNRVRKVSAAVEEALTGQSAEDIIAAKQRKLARLEALQEAADAKDEKAYFKALRQLVKDSIPSTSSGQAVDSAFSAVEQVAIDYLKLNEDEYVNRRMYDYLSNPENFSKLEQDIQQILTAFMMPAEKKSEPAAEAAKPADTTQPQAAAQAEQAPVEDKEFPIGKEFYAKDTVYTVRAVDGDNITLFNSASGKESVRQRASIRGWLASGIISETKPTADATEENVFKEAVKKVQLFQGSTEAFDKFVDNLLMTTPINPMRLAEFMAEVEKRRAQLAAAEVPNNPNNSFTFRGIELHKGLPIVIEDLDNTGKSRTFAGKVDSKLSDGRVNLKGVGGLEAFMDDNTKILALGEDAVNAYLAAQSKGTTTAGDAAVSQGNLDLEQDILKDQELVNELVDEALKDPAKAKADFLNNNKIC